MSRRPERVAPTAQTLAAVRYFAGLDAETRADVAARCRGALYQAQCAVVSHGDRSDDVHFLASGRVRATIMSAEGKIVSFRDIDAGEAFGDLSAIDGRPRSADVITLERSLVVSMSAATFWAVLEAHPSVARFALVELASLVRLLSERVAEFGLMGARGRIYAELARLAREAMVGENTARIDPSPTQTEIGQRVSARRESVAREMHKLIEAGTLVREGAALVVPDVDALDALVRELRGS